MRNISIVIVGVAFICTFAIATIALADRADVYLRAGIAVRAVTLTDDGAGNCSVTVCGTLNSADGGSAVDRCDGPVQLTGTPNTECENFLSTRARTLFIAQERL